VTEFDALEALDVTIMVLPAVLVDAVTVNVYAVPFVKPVTDIGLLVLVPVRLPGEEVAVYKLLFDGFPKYVGTVKATEADALPAVAEPIVGAVGLRPPLDEVTPVIGMVKSNLQKVPRS
jgi:hypothetical protein